MIGTSSVSYLKNGITATKETFWTNWSIHIYKNLCWWNDMTFDCNICPQQFRILYLSIHLWNTRNLSLRFYYGLVIISKGVKMKLELVTEYRLLIIVASHYTSVTNCIIIFTILLTQKLSTIITNSFQEECQYEFFFNILPCYFAGFDFRVGVLRRRLWPKRLWVSAPKRHYCDGTLRE